MSKNTLLEVIERSVKESPTCALTAQFSEVVAVDSSDAIARSKASEMPKRSKLIDAGEKQELTALPAGVPTSVIRSPKQRRQNLLDPVIEQAQKNCQNPWNLAEVWIALSLLADEQFSILIGRVPKGIKYQNGVKFACLTSDALRQRLERKQEREVDA